MAAAAPHESALLQRPLSMRWLCRRAHGTMMSPPPTDDGDRTPPWLRRSLVIPGPADWGKASNGRARSIALEGFARADGT